MISHWTIHRQRLTEMPRRGISVPRRREAVARTGVHRTDVRRRVLVTRERERRVRGGEPNGEWSVSCPRARESAERDRSLCFNIIQNVNFPPSKFCIAVCRFRVRTNLRFPEGGGYQNRTYSDGRLDGPAARRCLRRTAPDHDESKYMVDRIAKSEKRRT